MSRLAVFMVFSVVLSSTARSRGQTIVYVDDTAPGADNGTSWADAYHDLQDALAVGQDGDEINVAQGRYTPDRGLGNRIATFEVDNGVVLRGGYAGYGAPDPDERDITAYETILSGDLRGDDGPRFEHNTENSYQVVTGASLVSMAVLDGFSITGGNANGPYPNFSGGGMFNKADSKMLISQCTFRGNAADRKGGAIFSHASNPTMRDCIFEGNTAGQVGGAVHTNKGDPTVINCLFARNAARHGGGLYNFSGNPLVSNCTFVDNTAVNGRAIACATGAGSPPCTVTVVDSILWDGGGELWLDAESTASVSFCDVRGGGLEDGGFDDDPRFVPGPAGCYYLSQKASGQTEESPCIDRGSGHVEPLTVGDGTTRSDEEPDTGIVDLGFHYPVTGRTVTFGDVDRNGRLDLLDVAGLQNCFLVGPGDVSPCCRVYDFEFDNDVDLIDYAAFEDAFSAL